VEGDDLRCFYHGWKYSGDGQCVEQPAEPEPFCGRIKIRSYPVQEYLGLIFAYLGEGEAPPFERTPEFEKPEYITQLNQSIWPVNFFTNIDNALDMTHVPIVHPQLGDTTALHVLSARETEYGARVDGWTPPFHFCMPNIQEFGQRARPGGADVWAYGRGWRVPIDDRSQLRFGITIIPVSGIEAEDYLARTAARPPTDYKRLLEAAGQVISGELSPHDLTTERYGDLVNGQDYIAMVGIGDMAGDPPIEHLGRADAPVSLIRSIWVREVQALADGRPIKRWHRRDDLWSGGLSGT
jgi:5,5'-dehydrodivanillate O-demethylase